MNGSFGVEPLNVPKASRTDAEAIAAVTDAVCLEHLDEEYAQLCREVIGKLGRKRPSPILRGGHDIWAAGVIYAVGQLNFLFDPSQMPHATTDELSAWLGGKKTTMSNKAGMIRDLLGLSHQDAQFQRADVLAANPMIWLLEVNGLMVDIRQAPLEYRQRAFDLGLIPYVPQ